MGILQFLCHIYVGCCFSAAASALCAYSGNHGIIVNAKQAKLGWDMRMICGFFVHMKFPWCNELIFNYKNCQFRGNYSSVTPSDGLCTTATAYYTKHFFLLLLFWCGWRRMNDEKKNKKRWWECRKILCGNKHIFSFASTVFNF